MKSSAPCRFALPQVSADQDKNHAAVSRIVRDQAERLRQEAHLIGDSCRSWWLTYLDRHLDHYASVLSRLPPPASCGPVLEMGCMPGHLTVMMRELGYRVAGADLKPERLAAFWDAHAIKIQPVDIETGPLPFEDECFSMVLFTEILEHLRIQPLYAVREMFRVTRRGGTLILSVPNITPADRWDFLWGKDYQGDVVKAFEKIKTIGHPGHFRLYSIREINRILAYAGFVEIQHACEGPIKRKGLWRLLAPFCHSLRRHVYFMARRP